MLSLPTREFICVLFLKLSLYILCACSDRLELYMDQLLIKKGQLCFYMFITIIMILYYSLLQYNIAVMLIKKNRNWYNMDFQEHNYIYLHINDSKNEVLYTVSLTRHGRAAIRGRWWQTILTASRWHSLLHRRIIVHR